VAILAARLLPAPAADGDDPAQRSR
jgi:hypothetical protein